MEKYSRLLKRIGAWAMITGILSVLFYILHDFLGALYYPGYDRMRQAVSDLTASDAPSFIVAGGLSHIYGIFSCVCSAFLCVMIEGEKQKTLKQGIRLYALMNAVSAVGYSLFPLTGSGYDGSFRSFVHVYVLTALVVLLSVVSLVLIAYGSFRSRRRSLGFLSAAALACMLFGAAGSAVLPKEIFGITERFSTFSAVIFTAVLGIYGYFGFSEHEGLDAEGRNI